MTLWEILKANKIGIAPDMFTMLAASKMNGGRGRLHELSGIPPLSFTAKGNPLTAWSITGNTVQNGTPTPENPVEVVGVGDRTGNLFDYSTIRTGYRIAWATGEDYADNTAMMSDYIKVKNTTYSCSNTAMIICYDGNKKYLGALNKSMVVEKEVGIFCDMFTINDNECKFIKLLAYQGVVIGNKTMLNEGSTALPYEPYGYKIPVVTRGKNLFNYNDEHTTSGLAEMYTISNLDTNKYYTCSTSFEKVTGVGTASIYFAGGNSTSNGVWKDTPRTFKPDNNGQIAVYIRYKTAEGAPPIFNEVLSGEITVMVEEGSTATPYEPYHEPITTPIYLPTPLYSGEVMRSDSSREVKFHKLVLTGSEDWRFQSINSYGIANFYIYTDPTFKQGNKHFCTHFSIQTTLIAETANEGVYFSNNNIIYIRVKQELANTVSSLKSWLTEQYTAGTPVTIWYTLKTPTTETFTAPQIPTLNGTTVIDVDTAVKPESMTIKYRR